TYRSCREPTRSRDSDPGRRAGGAHAEGRAVEDAVARGKKIGARRLALPVGDHPLTRTVGVHHEDLVAREAPLVVGLEDDPFVVGGPVGLGVLAAEGQLSEVGEIFLFAGKEGTRRDFSSRRGDRMPRAPGKRRAAENEEAQRDSQEARPLTALSGL